MTATTELLDELARHFGADAPASDNRLASEYFKITRQKVSTWRTGRETFSDDRIVAICDSIWPGDDTQKARWLLRIHAEREKNVQVREVWNRLAKSVGVAVIVATLGLAPAPVKASPKVEHDIYYAKSGRRPRGPRRANPITATESRAA